MKGGRGDAAAVTQHITRWPKWNFCAPSIYNFKPHADTARQNDTYNYYYLSRCLYIKNIYVYKRSLINDGKIESLRCMGGFFFSLFSLMYKLVGALYPVAKCQCFCFHTWVFVANVAFLRRGCKRCWSFWNPPGLRIENILILTKNCFKTIS